MLQVNQEQNSSLESQLPQQIRKEEKKSNHFTVQKNFASNNHMFQMP
jgi:hypothetical protein